MKSGVYVCAALAAVVSLWASPAIAQVTDISQLSEAQEKEIACISEKLVATEGAVDDVVETFLYDDVPAEQTGRAKTALTNASGFCAIVYKWDNTQRELSETINLYSLVGGYLADDLSSEGVTDEQIDLIFDVLDGLPRESLVRFLDVSWMDDAEFTKRMNAALVAAKFPGDDEYILESARLTMEATVLMTSGLSEWVRVYINKQ